MNRSLRALWLMGSHSQSPAPREGFWELGHGAWAGCSLGGEGAAAGALRKLCQVPAVLGLSLPHLPTLLSGQRTQQEALPQPRDPRGGTLSPTRTYSEVLRDSAVQCASMGAVTTASNSSSCNSSSSPGAKYGDHPLTPPVVGSSAQRHPGALTFRHEMCFELEEVSSGGQEAASSASTVWAEPRDCQAFPALGLQEIRRPTRQPPSPPLPLATGLHGAHASPSA